MTKPKPKKENQIVEVHIYIHQVPNYPIQNPAQYNPNQTVTNPWPNYIQPYTTC